MAFCVVNGYSIDVTDPKEQSREIGSRQEAFNGNLLVDRRAIKREFTMESSLVAENDADMIRAIIQGRGHVFPFDEDVYSSKGLAPTGTPTYDLQGYAADGDEVLDQYMFGGSTSGGAVSVAPATVNMLSANQRSVETDTTGFATKGGAAILRDTDNYWDGAASLKVTTDGTGGDRSGARTTGIAASSSTVYVASLYAKAVSGTPTIRIFLYDADNAVTGTIVTATLSSTEWTRLCDADITTGAGAVSGLEFHFDENTIDSGCAFYVDGLQIEQKDEGVSTAWVDGTRASTQTINYSASVGYQMLENDFTVNLWLATADTTAAQGLFYILATSSTDGILLYHQNGNMKASIYGSGSLTGLSAAYVPDRTFDMITLAIRRNAGSAEHDAELYINGALEDYDDSIDLPDKDATPDVFRLGNSSFGCYGIIDDVMCLPYAASAAQIAAWYASGRAAPLLPKVELEGDIILDQRAPMTCIGQLGQSKFSQAAIAGSWTTNLRRVGFTLREF